MTSTRRATAVTRRVEHTYGVEPDRDQLEIDLLLAADRLGAADARDLSRHAGDERRVRRHAPPAPSRHAGACWSTASRPPTRCRRTTWSRCPGAACSASTKSASSPARRITTRAIDRLGEGLARDGLQRDGLVEAIERGRERPGRGRLDGRRAVASGGHRRGRSGAAGDLRRIRPAREGGEDRGRNPARQQGRTRAYGLGRLRRRTGRHGSRRRRAPPRSARRRSRSAIDHVGSTSVPGLGREARHRHPGVGGVTRSRARLSSIRSSPSGIGTAIDPIETEHEFLSRGYTTTAIREACTSTYARSAARGSADTSRSATSSEPTRHRRRIRAP